MTPYHRCCQLLAATLIAATACSSGARADDVADVEYTVSSPECATPGSVEERLWCNSLQPDSRTEIPRISAALGRMRAIGGPCARLANTVALMLWHGRVRLFDRDEYAGGGAAPIGLGGGSWLLLSRELIARYFDANHPSGNVDSHGVARPQTLQLVLAHEADHLGGEGHIDADGYLTRHAAACGDLPSSR